MADIMILSSMKYSLRITFPFLQRLYVAAGKKTSRKKRVGVVKITSRYGIVPKKMYKFSIPMISEAITVSQYHTNDCRTLFISLSFDYYESSSSLSTCASAKRTIISFSP